MEHPQTKIASRVAWFTLRVSLDYVKGIDGPPRVRRDPGLGTLSAVEGTKVVREAVFRSPDGAWDWGRFT